MATEQELAAVRKQLNDWIKNPVGGNMAGKIVSGIMLAAGLSADGATQEWVEANFLANDALNGYATEAWVNAQGFASEASLANMAKTNVRPPLEPNRQVV